MNSSKKCIHCLQWSEWQQRNEDRCEHCGELLSPLAYEEAQQAVIRAHQQPPSAFILHIDPQDGLLKRLFKRLVYGGKVVFAALLSFIIAVVAAAAG
ncbi:MAG: hypothetical protein EOO60_04545 [Hymenobacter sp.]|nr:MAG: hypothetical protein EOO60_04545 [Hymenobacter sp.]